MDVNRFNQILVVDSIPTGEFNTAKRLFEDLKTYASAYSPSPAVHYVRVESGDELIQCISMCRMNADEQDIIPMLHIECHGDEDGFQFADGSLADWDELKLPITELNVATRLNLLIAVAACTGGALGKVVRMSDRAPFWGLIGPTKTLTAATLERAYRALYLTLLSTKSPAKAVEAMDAATEPGLFWRTTSQGLFENRPRGMSLSSRPRGTSLRVGQGGRPYRPRGTSLSSKTTWHRVFLAVCMRLCLEQGD